MFFGHIRHLIASYFDILIRLEENCKYLRYSVIIVTWKLIFENNRRINGKQWPQFPLVFTQYSSEAKGGVCFGVFLLCVRQKNLFFKDILGAEMSACLSAALIDRARRFLQPLAETERYEYKK